MPIDTDVAQVFPPRHNLFGRPEIVRQISSSNLHACLLRQEIKHNIFIYKDIQKNADFVLTETKRFHQMAQ